ncbi:Inner membrane transport protein YajR [hydrothermal vent metagenome]|uniref:Inner membrane transport protein YajR n=1 Tax=hydrothermal vent metagenome TaxID=652676 RepID=A0A3B0XGD8_9ZZZZ
MKKVRRKQTDGLPGWSQLEKRAGISLASIYAVRMLGLFMILPVFVLYADQFEGATPMLTGLALGIYGLTQGLLQIPYGMLSDRFGRKPMIAIGLLIFAAGSLLAADADTIYEVIAGRALQGSGAVAAVLMALAADLSREEHRLKMMGFIGVSIGFAFALAMVSGPLLNQWVGLSGIFVVTAVLALFALLILFTWVPNPKESVFHRDTQAMPTLFHKVLKDAQLLRLNFGIFILHMVLMATYVAFPLVLLNQAGLAAEDHWKLYLPVFLISVALMVPFIIVAEAKRRMKTVFVGAIGVLAVAELNLLMGGDSIMHLAATMVVFFTAFNLLEASLPSLVSKVAPADRKGTAMGVYSSSQFIGAFVGGWAGGVSYEYAGAEGVFLMCSFALLLWFLLAYTMKNPRYVSTYLLKIGKIEPAEINQMISNLVSVQGVAEAVIEAEEGIAYLKVEMHALDKETLLQYSINNQN